MRSGSPSATPTPTSAERLDKEISEFNAAVTGHHDGRILSVAVHGDGGDLRAGLYGWTWGGCGYIDLLWVRRRPARFRPWGRACWPRPKPRSVRRGCDRVALNTHSFQAPGFYARFGYTRMWPGPTPGYPPTAVDHHDILARDRVKAHLADSAHDARDRGCRTANLQSTQMTEQPHAAVGCSHLGRIPEYLPAQGQR